MDFRMAITGMIDRQNFWFQSLLPGLAVLVVAAAGCVHLPPTVKVEMQRAEQAADNNFARDSEATPPQTHASK